MTPREKGPAAAKTAWTLAVATAVAGGLVALSSPAMAGVSAEGKSVSGHRAAIGVAQAATGLWWKTTMRCDHDDRSGDKKNGCPAGPPGPRGRIDGVESALVTPVGVTTGPIRYIAETQPNGATLVRDPTSIAPNPFWHDISSLAGYPGNVTGVTLSALPYTAAAAAPALTLAKPSAKSTTGVSLLVAPAPSQLLVTVRAKTGQVAETTCTATPNALWPANCTAFVDVTPPL
ncbi:hypothetical protein AB0O34_09825 [Sphaerisporangium sp. NPDC088356]|uniref:hypothetical protein n=1 Tax=Sphaerisporangium sp. NPDC088356 TaxID=3154871 RepID=UPI00342F6B2A